MVELQDNSEKLEMVLVTAVAVVVVVVVDAESSNTVAMAERSHVIEDASFVD